MKTQVFFGGVLSGIAEGWLESYVLYLAWPEWKGLKFYSPLWFGWKHKGIAGGSQSEDHKITVTCNVWVEPWVGLQGANKSAHLGGKLKIPSSCTVFGLSYPRSRLCREERPVILRSKWQVLPICCMNFNGRPQRTERSKAFWFPISKFSTIWYRGWYS